MAMKNQITVRLDEAHLKIIDGLQPHFGNNRPEVIRNLIVHWITDNIGSENIKMLQEMGMINLEKVEDK